MSSNVPISGSNNITAPTPQNTPLQHAPINLGLSRPTVPDITEDKEEDGDENTGNELSNIQQHMLGMVHGKLAGLVGKSSGYIENLPIEVKLSVEALKGVQVKQNDLQNKYKRECLELEKKVLPLTINPTCYLMITSFHLSVPRTAETIVRASSCDHYWSCKAFKGGDRCR